MKFLSVLKAAFTLIFALYMISCSSSRYQDGFSYKPAYAGPDMSSGSSETEVAETLPVQTAAEAPPPVTNLNTASLNETQKLFMEDMVASVAEDHSTVPADLKSTARKMAENYEVRNQVRFSEKQLKKLDRISLKMEKMQKKQGPDVNWGPANNLEWAILGAAAVGLFVGIFGVGFGWFIFILAALAYLYFKLLHNN